MNRLGSHGFEMPSGYDFDDRIMRFNALADIPFSKASDPEQTNRVSAEKHAEFAPGNCVTGQQKLTNRLHKFVAAHDDDNDPTTNVILKSPKFGFAIRRLGFEVIARTRSQKLSNSDRVVMSYMSNLVRGAPVAADVGKRRDSGE